MPKQDKYMSTVKVGPKGQIVIPKEARDMFGIEPGDLLMLMADSRRGIAIQKADVFNKIADALFAGRGPEIYPEEPEENLQTFAREIKKASNLPPTDTEE
jgi:AbrB family looped-hinge helix DNA binding protein